MNPSNCVQSRKILAETAIAQHIGRPARGGEDYARKRGLIHRSDDRSQSKREARPAHGRSGRREESCAYGCDDRDGDSGNTRRLGDRRLKLS
jgi:hypothetical protein